MSDQASGLFTARPMEPVHVKEVDLRLSTIGPVAIAREALRLAQLVDANELHPDRATALIAGCFGITSRVHVFKLLYPGKPMDPSTAQIRSAIEAEVAAIIGEAVRSNGLPAEISDMLLRGIKDALGRLLKDAT